MAPKKKKRKEYQLLEKYKKGELALFKWGQRQWWPVKIGDWEIDGNLTVHYLYKNPNM